MEAAGNACPYAGVVGAPSQTPPEPSVSLRCFAAADDDFEPVQSHQEGFCLTARHTLCARYVDARAAATAPPAAAAAAAAAAAPIVGAAAGSSDASPPVGRFARPLDPDDETPVAVVGGATAASTTVTSGSRVGIASAAGAAGGGGLLGGVNWMVLVGLAFLGGILLAVLFVVVTRVFGGAGSPTVTATPTISRTPTVAPIVIPEPTLAPTALPTLAPTAAAKTTPTATAAAKTTPVPTIPVKTTPVATAPAKATVAPTTPPAKATPTTNTSACNLGVTFAVSPNPARAGQPFTVTVTSQTALTGAAMNGPGGALSGGGSGTTVSFTDTRPAAGTFPYTLSANGGPCGGTAVTVQ